METRANYAIVGFFSVLVLAAAFGFIYWMSEFGRGGPMAQLIIRIPGSANGLSVGSPVRFNGIPVGAVRSLFIDKSDPNFSIAMTEVREDAPVTASTKAILEIQGLTGAAYVELSGGAPGDKQILKEAIDKGEPAVLDADQSSVTNLLATADKILKKADDAIGNLQDFIQDAREPLTQTVKNAQTFSQALANNADGIDKFLQSVSALSDTITKVSGRLDTTLAAVEDLVRAVDAKKVDDILTNAQTVSRNVADITGKVEPLVADLKQTVDNFKQFGAKANSTLDQVDKLMAAVDTQKVGQVVDDVSAATAKARGAIDSFAEVGNSVSARKQDIDGAITDFTQLANKLNNSSNRVDSILKKVDDLLGSDDTKSLSVEARKTLSSIREVADNLNKQIGPIAANFAKFSNTGLRNVEQLVNDTRSAVRNLNNTISNFDADPQRLLFGGETVKQYDGRTRR
ncbi:MlaD family protein [Rhizobium halophytocola]|uniref:Phospholipid/cholesterol/gamma-HCH transport system substrate-binding protein n=1 Tax=Rhizobium halophytocola TaxID=735519 RepID=A0ABS4DZ82_9HYPH|nr:MlaD family protein [Rhizobium halophytocola]MBP1850985.1 phospholipid/cholesterol/gamma-HCH transport system substrate-binding protein [Rhizobium halophytocola]